MAGLIRGGLVTRTDQYGQGVPYRDQVAQAYKLACDMNPAIASATNNAGQVSRAKAANKGVVTKVPGRQIEVEELSLSDDIEATYDKLARKAG